jgi:hypothetical protein
LRESERRPAPVLYAYLPAAHRQYRTALMKSGGLASSIFHRNTGLGAA